MEKNEPKNHSVSLQMGMGPLNGHMGEMMRNSDKKSVNMSCLVSQINFNLIDIFSGWRFQPTPLKNDGVRHLG